MTAVFLISCIKPFDYESVSYEKVIVVDGQFTDRKDLHKVSLHYTYPIHTKEPVPISGASMEIVDSQGNSFSLIETSSGIYRSMDSIAGTQGEEYQLRFSLSDGKSYESIPSKLFQSPPIDSIYDQYAELPSEIKNRNEGGIQFFLDVHDEANLAKYFRYEWEETYVIHVPYPSNVVYHEEDSTWEERIEPIGTCYQTNYSNQLILGNSIGSKTNRLSEFPIRFVSGENETLRSRYSILVRQYVLNDNAYNYYRKLRESIESGGTLFDKQQGAILGNIISKDSEQEPVLGYFEVSGITESRVFFNYLDLDQQLRRPKFIFPCLNATIETTRDSTIFYMEVYGGLLIVEDKQTMIPGELDIVLAPQGCSDCSWYATTVKPDFWKN